MCLHHKTISVRFSFNTVIPLLALYIYLLSDSGVYYSTNYILTIVHNKVCRIAIL